MSVARAHKGCAKKRKGMKSGRRSTTNSFFIGSEWSLDATKAARDGFGK